MGRPANQAAALLMAPLAVAAGVALMEGAASDVYMGAAGGLVLAAGLLFALRVAPWYLGSHLQWFFLVLPWLIVLLLLSRVFGPIGGTLDMPASVLAHGVVPVTLLVLLVFLSPTLMSFTRTLLQGGWALMGAGVASIVAGSLVAGLTTGDGADRYVHVLDLLGYGLVTVGLFGCIRGWPLYGPSSPF